MILKKGSKGEDVKKIQMLLGLTVDGVFGPLTEQAVKDYQKKNGLQADGIVGDKTWSKMFGVTPKEDIGIIKKPINVHVTKYPNRPIKYIAVHYTAGSTSKKGAAEGTRHVFLNREASADFVVDDETIVQINPDIKNYYCWAVGDKKNSTTGGAQLYGNAYNRNTISIEVCSNLKPNTTAAVPNHTGWYFTDKSIANTVRLVKYLMKTYNIPKSNVVRHYDITGKLCPGIVGWNKGIMFSTEGHTLKEHNNSSAWENFKQKL